jgi:nicotinamide-nucleotide amidase
MRVELINTGTELLLGSVINTHLKFVAEAIFPLGLRIARQIAVPDGLPIRAALHESLLRAEIIFVTGGLGPTTDDLTRDIAADLLGLDLEHDEKIMRSIEARFARRGLPMTARVARQAQRPQGAIVLENRRGTAPGLHLQAVEGERTVHVFLLPGPPRELHPMFLESVMPCLRELILPGRPPEQIRTYRIAGLGESTVEDLVGEELLALGVELGYCARPGEVEVRLIGSDDQLERGGKIIGDKLAQHIVSDDGRALEHVVVDLLTARGEKLAVAESCTGGFLAHRITNVPGASQVLIGGYVVYANEAKSRALGVDAALIEKHGAVSGEVVASMAIGALTASGADYSLATTGIAGPGGGTPEKPVGTVYIAFAARSRIAETKIERHRFVTDRETFKFLATQAALDLLRQTLG